MADKKISQLTNLTGVNLADNDEFVLVDTSADETKAITWSELKEGLDTGTGFVRITGDTMTGDLSFGDNDKAIFGAGSDLQIYHDGSDSIINDSGTGNLFIRGTSTIVLGGVTSNNVLINDGADVKLRYNSADKLATTSTGVDITGTLTSDGLTVDGDITATGGDLNLDTLDLNAIAETKGVTAVDVFVYDTSKDSDGGRWRHRCQGTSWYNETLNTATRGSRREFPAVAVIVAETNKVTIYDGDDPALPMWMVFNRGGSYPSAVILGRSVPNNTSVASLNGVLAVGIGTSGYGEALSVINFVSDSAVMHTSASSWRNGQDISGRNTPTTLTVDSSVGNIISLIVNDVAMTVLPDAPIDPATGLPVPTIAVATAGGVSVIKDDGTVVDITGGIPNSISFTEENRLFFDCDIVAGGSRAFRVLDIPSVDTNLALSTKPAGSQYYMTATFADSYPEDVAFLNGYAAKAVPNAIGFRTGTSHLALIAPKPDDNTKAMVAYTTSTYNTGWMNGDIKGAFLSDTDDTDLVGSAIAEYTFTGTGVLDGWSLDPTATNNNGVDQLDATTGGATNSLATRPISGLVVGATYVVSFERKAGTSGCAVFNASQNVGSAYTSTVGFDQFTFTANATSRTFAIRGNTINNRVIIDNVSVKLADADRSVNDNGLIVNGTVTRTPVATGADLVAYSGFSASNYLEQPYNSDLDFGTGDFCVMGWVKTAAADTGVFFSRGDISLAGTRWWFGQLTGVPYVYSNLGSITGAGSIPVNSWSHVVFMRLDDVCYFYINGALVKSVANTYNLTNTSAVSRAGLTYSGANAFTGSLALLRISATAPTAEQIAKIYEDEKVLFQENAQATLYGASDAVTALAHDDATNLLHVGTSAGRSVFQGLRRVSNTTTAVGTAISASNGLVVEE